MTSDANIANTAVHPCPFPPQNKASKPDEEAILCVRDTYSSSYLANPQDVFIYVDASI